MLESKLNKVADLLTEVLPENWEKVIFHGDFDDTYYDFYYYVKINNKYIQCFNLDMYGIDKESVQSCFEKIFKICSGIKKTWSSFDLAIDNEGSFKIDYNYENELTIDEWKEKYLNG